MLHRDLSGLCEIGLDRVLFEHGLDESSSYSSEATPPSECSADIPDVPLRHRSGLKRSSRVIDTLPRSNKRTDALIARGKEEKTEQNGHVSAASPTLIR